MVEGMSVVVNVMLSLMSVMSPPPAHCCEVMYFGCFDFTGELGFLNRDAICMCVVNEQFELIEFVFESVYVDLQYMKFLSLLLLGLCACVVFVVLGLSVRLSWYHIIIIIIV